MWKFDWKLKMTKEKWLIVLAAGVLLLILAIPSGRQRAGEPSLRAPEAGDAQAAGAGADGDGEYAAQMEKRVKQILKNVEGVGTVDVMIVLKSSEEKVLRVDTSTSDTSTQEEDGGGGTRKVTGSEKQESTVMTGSGGGPIVEKELKPEIAGIVISASGGGSPVIKAEISSAMEALFDLPPHKIKVLKRVE